MKAFSDFKAERTAGREHLPTGGYVAKIMAAKVESYDWGDKLAVSFDVADGQYKDFFKRDYNGQQGEDKKWRGVFRLNIPKDDGSEKDGWSKRSFGNAIWAIEASNAGYHWDWNEDALKGKAVGVLFRNQEWEMNGNSGWSTQPCAFTDVQSIKEGTFKAPKDKPLKNKPIATSGNAFSEIPAEDDDSLPF